MNTKRKQFILRTLKLLGINTIDNKRINLISLNNLIIHCNNLGIDVSEMNNIQMESKQYTKGCIYFIGNTEHSLYKIGFSRNKNVNNRYKTIQSNCPLILDYFVLVEGTFKDEKDYHKQYNQYHMHNEWFKIPFQPV